MEAISNDEGSAKRVCPCGKFHQFSILQSVGSLRSMAKDLQDTYMSAQSAYRRVELNSIATE